MTELGENKINLQLPEEVKPFLPDELHDFVFQEFKDDRYVDSPPKNWLIEHFKSTHPMYGGNIILMYNSSGETSYEVRICDTEIEEVEDREITQISKDIHGNPTRNIVARIQIDHKSNTVTTLFLDQSPNDQQL